MSNLNRIPTNNTSVLKYADGSFIVTLHETPIVTKSKHGTLVLRTGGYKSNTTKTRMNQVSNEMGLGFMVVQKDGHWVVRYQGDEFAFDTDTIIVSHRHAPEGVNA